MATRLRVSARKTTQLPRIQHRVTEKRFKRLARSLETRSNLRLQFRQPAIRYTCLRRGNCVIVRHTTRSWSTQRSRFYSSSADVENNAGSFDFSRYKLPTPLRPITSLKDIDWVLDEAKIIDTPYKLLINSSIRDIKKQFGVDFAVVTLRNIPEEFGSDSLKKFGMQLFNHWGLGDPVKNNGILFIMSLQERRVEIIVGRGLEEIIDKEFSHSTLNKIIPSLNIHNYSYGTLEIISHTLLQANSDQTDIINSTPAAIFRTVIDISKKLSEDFQKIGLKTPDTVIEDKQTEEAPSTASQTQTESTPASQTVTEEEPKSEEVNKEKTTQQEQQTQQQSDNTFPLPTTREMMYIALIIILIMLLVSSNTEKSRELTVDKVEVGPFDRVTIPTININGTPVPVNSLGAQSRRLVEAFAASMPKMVLNAYLSESSRNVEYHESYPPPLASEQSLSSSSSSSITSSSESGGGYTRGGGGGGVSW